MEKLLEMAKKVSDLAETYSLDERTDGISFENAKLKDIESRSQSGLSLRIIKDGHLGFAYTKNLLDRREFLQNALDSLKGGVEAPLDLPLTKNLPSLDTYDPSLEDLSNAVIVEECNRVSRILAERTKGQINLSAGRRITRMRLMNSRGTDLSSESSLYFFSAEILYPGSYSSIHRQLIEKTFKKATDPYLSFILDLYTRSSAEVHPKGGTMKVLFLPETIYTLMWRVQSITSGRNIYQKVSPVLGKLGEKIFDEKITIVDDPLNDSIPDARGFDDEGTSCRPLTIIEHGILDHFYYDLLYAKKMNASPTGHGFKSSMWGGETISFRPSPSLEHLTFHPGNKSFSELLKSIGKGIIVAGVMGAHSGNIQNGDFSVGLSPGLYVEKGEILGHVKDAMVAGNIFNTLRDVVGIEDTLHLSSGGMFPAILFDNVSVATKN